MGTARRAWGCWREVLERKRDLSSLRGLLAEAHPLSGRVCVCVCARVCVCVAEAMVPPVMGQSGPDHGGPHEWMNLPGLLFSPLPAGMSQSLQPFLSKPT